MERLWFGLPHPLPKFEGIPLFLYSFKPKKPERHLIKGEINKKDNFHSINIDYYTWYRFEDNWKKVTNEQIEEICEDYSVDCWYLERWKEKFGRKLYKFAQDILARCFLDLYLDLYQKREDLRDYLRSKFSEVLEERFSFVHSELELLAKKKKRGAIDKRERKDLSQQWVGRTIELFLYGLEKASLEPQEKDIREKSGKTRPKDTQEFIDEVKDWRQIFFNPDIKKYFSREGHLESPIYVEPVFKAILEAKTTKRTTETSTIEELDKVGRIQPFNEALATDERNDIKETRRSILFEDILKKLPKNDKKRLLDLKKKEELSGLSGEDIKFLKDCRDRIPSNIERQFREILNLPSNLSYPARIPPSKREDRKRKSLEGKYFIWSGGFQWTDLGDIGKDDVVVLKGSPGRKWLVERRKFCYGIKGLLKTFKIDLRTFYRWETEGLIKGSKQIVTVGRYKKESRFIIRWVSPKIFGKENFKSWVKEIAKIKGISESGARKIINRDWVGKKIRDKDFCYQIPFSEKEYQKIEKEYKAKRYKRTHIIS